MKKLLISAFALLLSANVFAYDCRGEGYDVSLRNGEIIVIGNGVDVRASVTRYGNNFVANVGSRSIRRVTFTPDDLSSTAQLTLVKSRGVDTINLDCR